MNDNNLPSLDKKFVLETVDLGISFGGLKACENVNITIKKGDYFIIFAVFRILCIFVNKSSIKYSFYKDLLPSRGLTFHSIKDVFP